MPRRRAMLIGVPEYRHIPPLEVVRKDVELLTTALSASEYEVEPVGVNERFEATSTHLYNTLDDFFKAAKAGETLLVAISGHGVHHNGRNYLVTADGRVADPTQYERQLFAVDFARLVDGCLAETVVVFLDACREGVDIGVKAGVKAGIVPVGWSAGKVQRVGRRAVVTVYSCGPGEYSHYTADGSLFTRALAEVLDPGHPARTIREVIDAAGERLTALAQELGKPRQVIRHDAEVGEEDIFARVICNGPAGAGPVGPEPWAAAAAEGGLWPAAGAGSDAACGELRERVTALAAACRKWWDRARKALPEDPWPDEGTPLRMLHALGLLVNRARAPLNLSAAEAALLTVAPFVREAFQSAAVVKAAAEASPLSLEPSAGAADGLRGELEKTHLAMPQMLRKTARLKERGRTEDVNAVAAWLMHRAVGRMPGLWLEPPHGQIPDELWSDLAPEKPPTSRAVREVLDRRRLVELARCLTGDPERIDRTDRPGALQPEFQAHGGRPEHRVRERLLAGLLCIAGQMAADPRSAPEVAVDHLGLTDPLAPSELHRTLADSAWQPAAGGLTLRAVCRHPAVDAALREEVAAAGRALEAVARKAGEGVLGPVPPDAIPARLTDEGIKPAASEAGVKIYDVPHIRFHLSQNEVRELLMGEQLYGDPSLAIRELYQNALDACRYRQARLQFLERTGKSPPGPKWEGRIEFRQAVDADGREYIECEDNGIGMGRRELEGCFARAGRRFHDTPEYIEEAAEWKRLDPPVEMFPNSQFGIGVFSYFMLADDIEISTCRLDRNGRPGKRMNARVSGSDCLFRVTEEVRQSEAGTRVRLYLNKTEFEKKRISCLETLRRWLWVAEFQTAVSCKDGQFDWTAGRLEPILEKSDDWQSSRAPRHWPSPLQNVWLVEGSGPVLADGIRVPGINTRGFIVNFRGRDRLTLTVDRSNAVDIDTKRVEHILVQAGQELVDSCNLSLEWLVELGTRPFLEVGRFGEENLALRVARTAAERGTLVTSDFHPERPAAKINLRNIGFCQFDAGLIRSMRLDDPLSGDDVPSSLGYWRLTQWKRLLGFHVKSHYVSVRGPAPWRWLKRKLSLRGFFGFQLRIAYLYEERYSRLSTVPLVLFEEDAVVLSRELDGREPWLWAGSIPRSHVRRAADKLGRPAEQLIARLERLAPFGVNVVDDRESE